MPPITAKDREAGEVSCFWCGEPTELRPVENLELTPSERGVLNYLPQRKQA